MLFYNFTKALIINTMRHLLLLPLLLLFFQLHAQDERRQAMQQAMMNAFGQGRCEVADSYAYDHSFTAIIRTITKKGKKEDWMRMEYMVSDDGNMVATRLIESSEKNMPGMTSVMDLEHERMISLMDNGDMKMALCISMARMMDQAEERLKEQPEIKFTKTGKTRVILDYTCEEWVSEDEENVNSYWIADKEDIPIWKHLAATARQKNSPFAASGSSMPTQGMMLLMESRSRKKGDVFTMEVTGISRGKTGSISTAGYQRM